MWLIQRGRATRSKGFGANATIEFRGTLVCDASKVPGVPRMLARSLNGTLEKLFVGKIAENLVDVGRGVGKLLEMDDAR